MSNVTDRKTLDRSSMTATEAAVAEIWCDLLELSSVDSDDNFFDLGATSLTAIRFLQRMDDTFAPDVLSPDDLYAQPKLGSVAAAIDRTLANGSSQAS